MLLLKNIALSYGIILPKDIIEAIKPYYNYASRDFRINNTIETLRIYIKNNIIKTINSDYYRDKFKSELYDEMHNKYDLSFDFFMGTNQLFDTEFTEFIDYNTLGEYILNEYDIDGMTEDTLKTFYNIVSKIIKADKFPRHPIDIGFYKFEIDENILTNMDSGIDPYEFIKKYIWHWYYLITDNCLSTLFLNLLDAKFMFIKKYFIDLLYVFVYNNTNVPYLKKQHENYNYMINYISINYPELLNVKYNFNKCIPLKIPLLHNKLLLNKRRAPPKNIPKKYTKEYIDNLIYDLNNYHEMYSKRGKYKFL